MTMVSMETRATNELESAISSALDRVQAPVSASQLNKLLPKPFQRKKVADLNEVLDRLVSERRAFKVAGKAPKFLRADPREAAESAIVSALREGKLKAKDLEARVKGVAVGIGKKDYAAILDGLVRTGRVHVHFKSAKNGLPGTTKEAYALEPQSPPDGKAFVAKALQALKDAFVVARRYRVAPAEVVAALVRASGLDHGALLSALGGSVDVALHSSVGDEDTVLDGLKLLISRERTGALIPISHLRRALNLNPRRFDSLVLDLERAGKVILHHHDFPGNLSENERAELVVDKYGTHYVGIALGRN
jgi:hypothetical protein